LSFYDREAPGANPRRGEMDAGTFEEYLEERYRREVAWYGRRARQNQRWYRVVKVYTVSAAAAIAALAAFEVPLEAVAALGASIATLEGLSGILKFHENWLNYRTTAETLKKEIHFYRSGGGDYHEAADAKALFVQRVEAIISRENSLWLQAVREKPTGAAKSI
jgi:methylthioribose-1-phosphate isomerase